MLYELTRIGKNCPYTIRGSTANERTIENFACKYKHKMYFVSRRDTAVLIVPLAPRSPVMAAVLLLSVTILFGFNPVSSTFHIYDATE